MASQERSEDKLNNILEIYNNSQDYNSSYTNGSLWVDTLRKPLIAHINLIKSSRKEIRGVQYCPDGLVNTSPKRPKRPIHDQNLAGGGGCGNLQSSYYSKI